MPPASPSRSSQKSPIRRALSSFPVAGWSNAPSHGSTETAAWRKISRPRSAPLRHFYMPPPRRSCSGASLVTHEIRNRLLGNYRAAFVPSGPNGVRLRQGRRGVACHWSTILHSTVEQPLPLHLFCGSGSDAKRLTVEVDLVDRFDRPDQGSARDGVALAGGRVQPAADRREDGPAVLRNVGDDDQHVAPVNIVARPDRGLDDTGGLGSDGNRRRDVEIGARLLGQRRTGGKEKEACEATEAVKRAGHDNLLAIASPGPSQGRRSRQNSYCAPQRK